MMRKDILTILSLLIILIILVFVQGYIGNLVEKRRGQRINVKIGPQIIQVIVAETNEQRIKGLAGKTSLAPNEGMLLVFDHDDFHRIWMKGVNFPIDIIWIAKDKRVVAIEKNVKPQVGVSDFELAIYTPQEEARYVLEVQANLVNRLNIKVGDMVAFEIPKKTAFLNIFWRGF